MINGDEFSLDFNSSLSLSGVRAMGGLGCGDRLCHATWSGLAAHSTLEGGQSNLVGTHSLWGAWVLTLLVALALCTFGTPRGSFLRWRSFLRSIDFRTDIATVQRTLKGGVGDGRFRELPDDGRFVLGSLRRERHSVTGGFASLCLLLGAAYGIIGLLLYDFSPNATTLVAVDDSSGPAALAAVLTGAHSGLFGLGGLAAARDFYLAGDSQRNVTYAAYQISFEIRDLETPVASTADCRSLLSVTVPTGTAQITLATAYGEESAVEPTTDAPNSGGEQSGDLLSFCSVVADVRLQLPLSEHELPSFSSERDGGNDNQRNAGISDPDAMLSIVAIHFSAARWSLRRVVLRASVLQQTFGGRARASERSLVAIEPANDTALDENRVVGPWSPSSTYAAPDRSQCALSSVQKHVFSHATACSDPHGFDYWSEEQGANVNHRCQVRSARLAFLTPLNSPWLPQSASLAFDHASTLASGIDACDYHTHGSTSSASETAGGNRTAASPLSTSSFSFLVGVRATSAIVAQIEAPPSFLPALARAIVIIGVCVALHPLLRKAFKLFIVRSRRARRYFRFSRFCACFHPRLSTSSGIASSSLSSSSSSSSSAGAGSISAAPTLSSTVPKRRSSFQLLALCLSGVLAVSTLGVPLIVLGPARAGVVDDSLSASHALVWMICLIGALLLTAVLSVCLPCARPVRVGVALGWLSICIVVAANVGVELIFSTSVDDSALISPPLAWLEFVCALTLAAALLILLAVAWRNRRHQGTYGVDGIANPLLLYEDDDEDQEEERILVSTAGATASRRIGQSSGAARRVDSSGIPQPFLISSSLIGINGDDETMLQNVASP